jgi:hypothetical protein
VFPGNVFNNLKLLAITALAVLCFLFQFVGVPDLVHSRSFKYAWDLGHIAAFAVWSVLLFRWLPWLHSLSIGKKVFATLLFCILLGGLIEFAQVSFGHYPSWSDMGRNILGGLSALFFLFRTDFPWGEAALSCSKP